MNRFYAIAVLVGVVIFSGCSDTETEVTEKKEEKSSGYIEVLGNAHKKAKNVEKLVDTRNEEIQDAINKIDNKLINKKNMSNVPEQIDMKFAENCKGANIVTNLGTIELELFPEKAPITVSNFCTLADKGFYDNVIFHRVIKGFMIQGGDPTGTGTGGPGYKFEDELPNAGEYKLGSIAMANAGPDTNGSQFFIVSGDNGISLPPSYSLFGQVTNGMNIVSDIENVEIGFADKPMKDVVIRNIELIRK